MAAPARSWIKRGLPFTTQGRLPTFVTVSQPTIWPVAPCQPADAVRSLGTQVGVPDGIGTRVEDGTGVGVASVHGTMEPDGELGVPALARADGEGDGDCRSSVLAGAPPQPASARAARAATRLTSVLRGTASSITVRRR